MTVNLLIWNIRGVRKKIARPRLKSLKEIHKLSVLALLEPLVPASNLDFYKEDLASRRLSQL